MDNRETQCSAPTVALAFLGGAVAGVVVGLLLAPKSGEDTRGALKGYARKMEEEVLQEAKEARTAVDETIERGKHFMAEKTADAEAAVKAGREAMKEKWANVVVRSLSDIDRSTAANNPRLSASCSARFQEP